MSSQHSDDQTARSRPLTARQSRCRSPFTRAGSRLFPHCTRIPIGHDCPTTTRLLTTRTPFKKGEAASQPRTTRAVIRQHQRKSAPAPTAINCASAPPVESSDSIFTQASLPRQLRISEDQTPSHQRPSFHHTADSSLGTRSSPLRRSLLSPARREIQPHCPTLASCSGPASFRPRPCAGATSARADQVHHAPSNSTRSSPPADSLRLTVSENPA